MITDTLTGSMKLMYAEDYDTVMRKFAESTDPSLMDDRSKYLTRYFIRPLNRPQVVEAPRNFQSPSVTPQDTTVEMPQGSMDSTPIRVTRGSRRPREDPDDITSPPPQRRGESGLRRGTYRESIERPRASEGPPATRVRRAFTATELRDAEYQPSDIPPQPSNMDFSGNPILGVDNRASSKYGKRGRSLKDIYEDPASNKKIRNNPPQGTKRQTYREGIERSRAGDRDARDGPSQGAYNPVDWGFGEA